MKKPLRAIGASGRLVRPVVDKQGWVQFERRIHAAAKSAIEANLLRQL
jgi:hypothetical protein